MSSSLKRPVTQSGRTWCAKYDGSTAVNTTAACGQRRSLCVARKSRASSVKAKTSSGSLSAYLRSRNAANASP